ncbi:MAG TPA: hypothetical protein VKP58_06585 [Candidatus Acidoferrum sp.]|nr:hypothetical protein [Candidatus Acidoferrum sp.]
MPTDQKSHSRREFARRAALLSLGVPLAAASPLPSAALPSASGDQQLPKLPPDFPKLSEQSRAEVEARFDSIVKQYAGRFNDQQKAELRRLSFLAQPALDKLRAYTIQNGDSPALYLKPAVEREKKPAKPAAPSPAATAKKP